MCKYLLDLIGFNADEPEDYYDTISTNFVCYNNFL